MAATVARTVASDSPAPSPCRDDSAAALHQVGIDGEQIGERLERAGKRTDAPQRLRSAVIEPTAFYLGQPQQVEQSPIARQHIRAQRGHGGKAVGVVVLIGIVRLAVVLNVHDEVLAGLADSGNLDVVQQAIEPGPSNQALREADHQPPCPPVGQIEVQIEPALHHPSGTTLQRAPVIFVGKARGGNARPRRHRPQGLPVRLVQWTVDCLELVILVLAQKLPSLVVIAAVQPVPGGVARATRPPPVPPYSDNGPSGGNHLWRGRRRQRGQSSFDRSTAAVNGRQPIRPGKVHDRGGFR